MPKYSGYSFGAVVGRKNTYKATLTYYEETVNDRGEIVRVRRQKTKSFTGYRTKREAKAAADDWRLEMELAGSAASSSAMSVADWVDQYVERRSEDGTPPSTVRDYRLGAKRVRETIGEVTLAEINVDYVEKWKLAMQKAGRWGESLRRKTFFLLKAALNDAVARDLIPKNPCAFVKAPRKSEALPNPLSAAERRRLIDILGMMTLTRDSMAIWIILFTGCRPGEAAALRWKDFDMEPGVLGRRWVHLNGGIGVGDEGAYAGGGKNSRARRSNPLEAEFLPVLDRWREQQDADCAACGVQLREDMYVLSGPRNEVVNPECLTHTYTTIAKLFGIEGIAGKRSVLYDLRATYLKHMEDGGASLLTTSKMAGHANIQTTAQYYVDADAQAKVDAIERCERMAG